VFSAHRKRLTRRTTSHKINTLTKTLPVERTHITFFDIPASDKWIASHSILANGVTSPFIPLDNGLWLKPRQMDSHSQTTGASEQLHALHATPPSMRRKIKRTAIIGMSSKIQHKVESTHQLAV
jgi:hypothetical protein